MDSQIDLSGITLMIIAVPAIIIPQIRLRTIKKTLLVDISIVLTAIVIYGIIIGINLRPIPANGTETVYVTSTGAKYHDNECYHLRQGKFPASLEEAISSGYGACSHCAAPEYVPETIYPHFTDLYSQKGAIAMIVIPLTIPLGFAPPILCYLCWRLYKAKHNQN